MSCIVCEKPLPDLAVEQKDDFCTSACARAYHGCPLPVVSSGPTDHACTGCGCHLDEQTAGCAWCTRRHRRRGEGVLGKAAASVRSGEAVQVAAVPSTDEFADLELLARLEDEAA